MSVDKRLLACLPDGTPNPDYDKEYHDQVKATPLSETVRRSLNEEARAMVGAIMAEAMDEARQKAIEAAKAEQDKKVERKYTPMLAHAQTNVVDRSNDTDEKGAFARIVKYMYEANSNAALALDLAHRAEDHLVVRALGESTFAGGGALLQGDFGSVIEELGAEPVLLQAPVQRIPLNGTFTAPYISSDATAAWAGENSASSSSNPTYGQMSLRDHRLYITVPVSDDLFRNGGPAFESMLRNHIMRSGKRQLDIDFIRGLGTSNTPKGLRYLAASGNLINSTGTTGPTLTQFRGDLWEAKQALMDADVLITSQGTQWIMAPRPNVFLSQLSANDDKPAFAEELARGLLLGHPVSVTSQIPDNLGAGSNETEIYLYNAPDIVVGIGEELNVEVFRGGTYYDGSANQSGISRGETVVRLRIVADINASHQGNEIAVITDSQATV